MSNSIRNRIATAMGNEVIKIRVGHERKEYSVHKALFSRHLASFEQSRASDSEMTYATDESPEVFELLIGWLYQGIIPTIDPKKQSTPTNGLFGQPRPTSLFGQPTPISNSLFSASTIKTPTADQLPSQQSRSNGLFGTIIHQSSVPPTSLFAQQPSEVPSLFSSAPAGTTSSASEPKPASLFSSAISVPSATNIFGRAVPLTTEGTVAEFLPKIEAEPNGQIGQLNSYQHVCFTLPEAYFSPEELRAEDYARGKIYSSSIPKPSPLPSSQAPKTAAVEGSTGVTNLASASETPFRSFNRGDSKSSSSSRATTPTSSPILTPSTVANTQKSFPFRLVNNETQIDPPAISKSRYRQRGLPPYISDLHPGHACHTYNDHVSASEEEYQMTLLRLILLAETIKWPALFDAAVTAYITSEENLHRFLPITHISFVFSNILRDTGIAKYMIDCTGSELVATGGWLHFKELLKQHEEFMDGVLKIVDPSSGLAGGFGPKTKMCAYHTHPVRDSCEGLMIEVEHKGWLKM